MYKNNKKSGICIPLILITVVPRLACQRAVRFPDLGALLWLLIGQRHTYACIDVCFLMYLQDFTYNMESNYSQVETFFSEQTDNLHICRSLTMPFVQPLIKPSLCLLPYRNTQNPSRSFYPHFKGHILNHFQFQVKSRSEVPKTCLGYCLKIPLGLCILEFL